MTDPLKLLRQFNVNKQNIVEKDDDFVFGEYSWAKNTKTNYIVKSSGKEELTDKYYTLECLVYFLKNAHLFHPEYVKKATEENIPVVRRPCRKAVLAYLNGGPAIPGSIDESVSLENPKQIKRSVNDDPQKEDIKKPKLEEGSEVVLTKAELNVGLDLSKHTLVKTEQTYSLPDSISAEKINEIRAKRLAKRNVKIEAV